MITEAAREAEAEYGDANLEVRVEIRVVEVSEVSARRILDTAQDVLTGALSTLGLTPESVSALLADWHTTRADEARQTGEF